MDKEINYQGGKYRGRHIVTKKWVYGYLLAPNVIGTVEVYEKNPGEGKKPHIATFCMVDPVTVEPSSGVTDSNGKEIFVGDVINIKNHTVIGNIFKDPELGKNNA